jgi:hypothetical protein
MTVGEVEEFLWSLSTCLEGEIGNWRLRFGGSRVSVCVNRDADEVAISATSDAGESFALRTDSADDDVRSACHGSAMTAAMTASLSRLTIKTLQAAFQQVVDRAHQPNQSDSHEP